MAQQDTVIIGITTKKSENFSEWYTEAVTKSELVDVRYNVQGCIVHRPLATRIIRNLYSIWERELEDKGHEPTIFPTFIPEENFEKEREHVAGFEPEVFWVTEVGGRKLERRLALRPTSETAMYQMYSLWIRSWRDLPLKLYQSCSVFRFEPTTRPFIRGREFLWIEAHDAFATREGAENQVKEDIEISKKVLHRLGIPFLLFERPSWDTFAGAEHTYACDVLMPDGRTIQVATTHFLGQNFAKPFDVKFKSESGEDNYVYQTCYGPGIWRVMAALVSVHGDDKGLIMPFEVAATQAVIIPIARKAEDGEKVVGKCKSLLESLRAKGLKVELDLTENTPGFKYNHWELRGVPIRIEIGPRELQEGKVTLVRRDTRQKVQVEDGNIEIEMRKMADDMLNSLREKAQQFLQLRVSSADSIDETKEILDKTGGYVKIGICSMGPEGKGCADVLKDATSGGKVRGIIMEDGQKAENERKCIICGKPGGVEVFLAKQY